MGEQPMKIAPLMHTALAAAWLLLMLPTVPAASAASPAASSDVQATPLPDLQTAAPPDSQATPPDSGVPRGVDETYSVDEIVDKAAGFFGATTEVIAKAV